MRQPLLSISEVRRLDGIYCEAYRRMSDWRRDEPLAAHIHLPKVPEPLSVSIAAMLGPDLIGEELCLGSGRHDLLTRSGKGVAVKGTGPSQWITVTASDRQAAWLIWVDYAGRVRTGDLVVVLAIPVHTVLTKAPARLTRSQLDRLSRRVHSCRVDPTALHAADSCDSAVTTADASDGQVV